LFRIEKHEKKQTDLDGASQFLGSRTFLRLTPGAVKSSAECWIITVIGIKLWDDKWELVGSKRDN
jgi:hypothetical protein